ncbi:hypothetical protein CO180_02790 [candidate division WWE3 bacterium CG_4_9_14_3_um_filter_41_6]|uniref:Methyltransferase domain-containing protein n=1 Tax=candidate division WWE3 bacterium CG_4_10_14_0_2_um_filter_41_14 TaxID=1975072 RepID=A0A2M7TJ10_UNCKA|nr:MAG: hypothetical protein COY32_03275 [candidate division WWE3 bacterium CG_4_10_14_0_2_um_filter_41_14]PJA38709.1 MAG: hypothetical protein CO180_02790 [candidate division WWE3 bacterium CG_4_9_14_3_um_filter_41_6]
MANSQNKRDELLGQDTIDDFLEKHVLGPQKKANSAEGFPSRLKSRLSEWSDWYKDNFVTYAVSGGEKEELYGREMMSVYYELILYLSRRGGYEMIEEEGLDSLKLSDTERKDIFRFFSFDLWSHYNSAYGIPGEPSEILVDDYRELLEKLKVIASNEIPGIAREDTREDMQLLFEGFSNTGNCEFIEEVLVDGRFSSDQLEVVSVAGINTFGFIPTIDAIAKCSRIQDLPDEVRDNLKTVYTSLQGEEVAEIRQELSEIYERIDFSEYVVNTDKLTEFEVNLLTDRLPADHNPTQTRVVDLGAGTGRHTVPLSRKGYRVTSVEPEKKHCDKIAHDAPDATVIQSDWGSLLKKTDPPIEKWEADMVYVLGRSATHNRTPAEMVAMMDAASVISKDDATFVIDFADVDFEVYKDRITHLKESLARKGVDMSKRGVLFDGPNDLDRFNRLVLDKKQIEALATLFGYSIDNVEETRQGENGEIRNMYYTLKKCKEGLPRLSFGEIYELYSTLDLMNMETDFNTYVERWGMTLGQAIIFVQDFGLSNMHLRELNEDGRGPKVHVSHHGKKLFFSCVR